MTRIFIGDELVATCAECDKTYVSGDYDGHHIEWDCWCVGELYWSHKAALLLLQGSSMQQLLTPLVLLKAHPRPPYAPRPGAYDVVLGEMRVAPEPPLHPLELFQLLMPDASRLCTLGD